MAAFKSRRDRLPPGEPPKPKSIGADLSNTTLPPSLQKPHIYEATPTPQHGYGPVPMATSRDSVKDEATMLSEAQQQLHTLLARQLDTSKSSVESVLGDARQFTPAVVYQPLANEMKGLATLSQYVSKEEEVRKVDSLRQLGLTQQEIELKLQEDSDRDLIQPSAVKRRKLGAEPSAQQQRINAVNKKISDRQKMVEEPTKYHGVRHMSRHAAEVERSLFRGSDTVNQLQHLTSEENGTYKMAYPASVMPKSKTEVDPKTPSCSDPQPTNKGDVPTGKEGAQESEVSVLTPIPVQVIERNRLTEAEIRALPRFRNYTQGEPSKVLYLKNLDCRVSANDLRAVFGGDPSSGPHIRLMRGRMKGQAFLEFDLDAATKALYLVNGYQMRDKPVIISFGRVKSN